MFNVILFSALAVLLVVSGLTLRARNRSQAHAEGGHHRADEHARRERKAERAQSRRARRKRH